MSDTVKLIVEIPKDYYEIIKHDVDNHLTDYRPFEIIANGTLLDDVKAEIDKAQEPYITSTAYDEGVRFGLMLAYQIVDRYMAESEDT